MARLSCLFRRCAVPATLALVGLATAMAGASVAHAERAPTPAQQACARGSGIPEGFPVQRHAGMVRIPGGTFTPGTLHGYPDERPAGEVLVRPFWMDRTEVSNAQFAQFVAATGYVTEAEREGGAAVFRAPGRHDQGGPMSWWHWVPGANWRQPEGPQSHIRNRMNQPVVQVTLADALAYANWLGRALPTEAEWELAARGGGDAEALEREPRRSDGTPTANFWQGVFPSVDAREDGYGSRAPVACFPANGYGLHDVIGNVWEWTVDPYQGAHQGHGHGDPARFLRAQRAHQTPGATLVIKGGSFLCASNYCARYRSTARHPHENNLPTAHIGFRTVIRSDV